MKDGSPPAPTPLHRVDGASQRPGSRWVPDWGGRVGWLLCPVAEINGIFTEH